MIAKRNGLAALLVAGGIGVASIVGWAAASAADDTTPDAAPAGGHWPGHHGWGPGRLYHQLGLSTEQQASMKALFTEAKPQMKSLHEQARANHLKLTQTQPDDPNYAAVVAEVAQSEATLASQRTLQAADLRSKMYALLTPEQKIQLATLEAAHAPAH